MGTFSTSVTRKSSSELSQKISPRSLSSEGPQRVTSRAVRQLKTIGLEIDPASSSSSNQQIKTPKSSSHKVTERRSPRSLVTEKVSPISKIKASKSKKHPGKVTELESQISRLQEDLKTVKDQLISSETWKKEAQQDAEESRKQLLIMSTKLEESQMLLAQSISEEPQSIQNISEEENQSWKSKLELIRKQHSMESTELTTATNEIEQLKVQLKTQIASEATKTQEVESANSEINILKENLAETLSVVEEMKSELNVCKESEAQAQALVGQTLSQLEIAKKTIESLKSDGNKSLEEYDVVASELDQSKARVDLVEGLVNKLNETDEGRDGSAIEAEIVSLKSEVEKLRSALEIADMRYNEQQIRSTVHIESARELVEQIKSISSVKEAELEAELQKSKADIEELKANLMDKETELQGICEENDDLLMKLKTTLSGQREIELEKEQKKLKDELDYPRASLMDKEIECQYISEENKKLKSGMEKNGSKVEDDDEEKARVSEKENLMMDEREKRNQKIARVTEQLEAAQAENLEMEAELRRLKVQSDQWRKAAEVAAAMLSTGNNNGKFVERTGSLDSNYSPIAGPIISLPYSEEMDDDFLKKKSGNVLKRIGVLWKKPQNRTP